MRVPFLTSTMPLPGVIPPVTLGGSSTTTAQQPRLMVETLSQTTPQQPGAPIARSSFDHTRDLQPASHVSAEHMVAGRETFTSHSTLPSETATAASAMHAFLGRDLVHMAATRVREYMDPTGRTRLLTQDRSQTRVDKHGFYTDPKALLSDLNDPNPSLEKRAFIQAMFRNYAVLSKDSEFYQSVHQIFRDAFKIACQEDPSLKNKNVDFLVIDSPHLNAFAHRTLSLVMIDMTYIRFLAQHGRLTPHHLASALCHEMRHLSQSGNGHSLQREFDADYYGMHYASRAGYNPLATLDTDLLFHHEHPSDTGLSMLKSHPKSLARVAFAAQINSRPMPGQDKAMDKALEASVPRECSARAFQEEVVALNKFDKAKIEKLIATTRNMDELLLLTQQLQDLAMFEAAKQIFQQIPWYEVLSMQRERSPYHVFNDVNDQAFPRAQSQCILPMQGMYVAHRDRYQAANNYFPGTRLDDCQSIGIIGRSQTDLVPEEQARALDEWNKARGSIDDVLEYYDEQNLWAILAKEGCLPFLLETSPENLTREQKIEILYRLAWIGCCEQVMFFWNLFQEKGDAHSVRSFHNLEPIQFGFQHPKSKFGSGSLRPVEIGMTFDPQIMHSVMRQYESTQRLLSDRYRVLLAKQYGIAAYRNQDLYITLFAGVIAGRHFDWRDQSARGFQRWAQRYPRISQLVEQTQGTQFGTQLNTTYSLLELVTNGDSRENIDNDLQMALERCSVTVHNGLDDRSSYPFGRNLVTLTTRELYNTEADRVLPDFMIKLRDFYRDWEPEVQSEIQQLQQLIAEYQADEKPDEEDIQYCQEKIERLQRHLNNLHEFIEGFEEFVTIAHGLDIQQQLRPIELTALASHPRYVADRLPYHHRTKTTESNNLTILGFAAENTEELKQESTAQLVQALAQAIDEDHVDHFSQSDPLGSYKGIKDKIEGLSEHEGQRAPVYIRALIEKLQEGEDPLAIIEALDGLPRNQQLHIWELLLKSINKHTLTNNFDTLLDRIEEATATILKKQPVFFERTLRRKIEESLSLNEHEAIAIMLEDIVVPLIEELRQGKISFKDFLDKHYHWLHEKVFNYGHPAFAALVERHPLLKDFLPYAMPDENTKARQAHSSSEDVKLPLTNSEIRELARGLFPSSLLDQLEASFESSFENFDDMRSRWNSGSDSFQIQDPFAHFLFPFVLFLDGQGPFSSFREAFFEYMSITGTGLPQAHLRACLWILTKGMTPVETDNLVKQVKDAYESQIANRARILLDREPTSEETIALSRVSFLTINKYTTRYRNYNHGMVFSTDHQKTLTYLSNLLILGSRRTGRGLDRNILLSPFIFFTSIEASLPSLDISRESIDHAYNNNLQDASFEQATDKQRSNYPNLVSHYWRRRLATPITSASELRELAAQANQDITPLKYQETYGYKPLDVSYSSAKGTTIILKIHPNIQTLSAPEVATCYEHRRPEMSNFFTEHSEQTLSGIRQEVDELANLIQSQLDNFEESELSTREKIVLTTQFLPEPCLQRDAIIIRLVDQAPEGFLDNNDHVALVTNNLLLSRHRDRLGQQAFQAWYDKQSEASLRALGAPSVATILLKFYPEPSYARDDAIEILLNGTAQRPMNWVQTINTFQTLWALRQPDYRSPEEDMSLPKDITKGTYLIDWLESLPIQTKEEMFLWLIGKRDLPPTHLMHCSISPNISPKEPLVGQERVDAINAYKGEHFDTLKSIFRESGRGLFMAYCMALFAGSNGLLTNHEGFQAESFLRKFLSALNLDNILPESWLQLFLSFITSTPDYEAARILAEILYRISLLDDEPTQEEMLDIFITTTGFVGIKFAQIAGQQGQLIADPALRAQLASFQSLPQAGKREEAFVLLELWAKEKGIPQERVRLGTLIATASAGQVYEVHILQQDGNWHTYAFKFILQRNRFGIDERIHELEETLDNYRERSGADFDSPGYLFHTLREESSLELSLEHEQKALSRLDAALSKPRSPLSRTHIRVPEVYPKLSSNTVLVMEYVDNAITLKDLIAYAEGRKAGILPINPQLEALANKLDSIIKESRHTLLRQIGLEGFYHGDLHPGNILIKTTLVNGKPDVIWLDAGNAKDISKLQALRSAAVIKLSQGEPLSWNIASRVMLAGVAKLYPQVPAEQIHQALQAARTKAEQNGSTTWINIYQTFVLSLAQEHPEEFNADIGLMTALLKASQILIETK